MTPFLAAWTNVVPVGFTPEGSFEYALPVAEPVPLKEERCGMLFVVRTPAEG